MTLLFENIHFVCHDTFDTFAFDKFFNFFPKYFEFFKWRQLKQFLNKTKILLVYSIKFMFQHEPIHMFVNGNFI